MFRDVVMHCGVKEEVTFLMTLIPKETASAKFVAKSKQAYLLKNAVCLLVNLFLSCDFKYRNCHCYFGEFHFL